MRARLIAGGEDAFHDYELLEYVLALVTPRRDTKPLAKRLIAEFGTLSSVLAATPAELSRVDGLGDTGIAALKFVQAASVRALRDDITGRPLLSSWQAVIDYLHADMAHGAVERFRVLFLNNRNLLIRSELMAEGTVNQAPVYVREVMKRALELGATAIVLAHNHPSGDPQPSRDDIAMTAQIAAAGKALGIALHDHVVIGRSGHASFRQLGLI
ncbi:DNA repair protein RadC [Sphingoaurantiacus capsulatus]|uniref:DNA repair protein RadC n=1 Tax=Sphingoaurantiacus capsulatus TaxID=1771310 RepID=A0ABV7XAP5_9SPHN